ncbi:39S ribosomal protein L4, mitochondrial-like isoform X1 [Homarus americanus]|uniref:39S ribosomal protein L4, mitochondrial-like isoform X1 n=1 Tax=Homarus americanus TaxID=6706 RepID=UPI001C447C28|nr:39S ribosomal protein L4, mitochondrial-like isoform X1 [Homarus americanus]
MALNCRSYIIAFRNAARTFGTSPGWQSEAVAVPQSLAAPLILDENFNIDRKVVEKREAWIETLDTSAPSHQVGLIHLHPKVFADYPRLDIIHENAVWQQKFRMVNTAHTKLRSEVRGGGKKPHPQKGLGRARHGSIRSPLWVGGGRAHGPRAFTTQFYMLPFAKRIRGLTSTLSAKFSQDDLKIVENLDLPSDEAGYLEKLCEERCWGPSVLFVDDTDLMPRNITIATDTIQHVNLMPVYGLNVHSMLKHETLVLTVSAARRIEERLLYHLNRPDFYKMNNERFKK